MKAFLFKLAGIQPELSENPISVNSNNVSLLLVFGSKEKLLEQDYYSILKADFPASDIVFCSTAGEIFNQAVCENSITVVALEFEKTTIQSRIINIQDYTDSKQAGMALMSSFDYTDLSHVLVFSDGNKVNGSQLVKGFNSANSQVTVSGGIAGDGNNFQSTLTGLNQTAGEGYIVAIGFYGSALQVTQVSKAGWDMFGLEKTVTKSVDNRLFEIDHTNALELYKLYLGNHAAMLPGSALLFPLSVLLNENSKPVVRTILSIDEGTQSMIFAGDVPEGAKIRFMKANFDKLVDAATSAAQELLEQNNNVSPEFALVVSCVGRKLVLGNRIEEEVEAVTDVLGQDTTLAGFFSYGELASSEGAGKCNLHNQTITITSFREI